MRIGIYFHADQPLESSEVNQTAWIIAELCSGLMHDVVLVHQYSNIHYDSIPISCSMAELSQVDALDWLIDIDGHLSMDVRSKATRTIVFLRTFLQFEEMNASVYADYPYHPRNMSDVYEIWCWDILNPEATIPSIQTLFPCPIRRVPFIWKPVTSFTSTYHKEESWTIHVSEENTNTSSTFIPLCAIKELVTTYKIPAIYQIHNAESIKENRFFKENILANLEADTLPLSYEPWEPCSKWNINSIVLSHLRFASFRPALLECIYHGIPLIHNSPVIAELHPLLKTMSYTENRIQELCTAVTQFLDKPEEWYDKKSELCDVVIKQFGMEANKAAWKCILDSLPVKNTVISTYTGTITVAFLNMWEGFNYDSNFITDALRHFSKQSVNGIPYYPQCNASFVICGPHGQPTIIPRTIPKVFWSAENWPLPHDTYSLYVTNSIKEDDTHLRIPTWMIFIDWFTTNTTIPIDCTDNPIRFPLSMAMQPHPVSFQERDEFCAFVVSNPSCTLRNDAFHYVNQYKKVHSGGGLYNNIGGQLSLKYPGGGCGDVSKYEFFSKHQFTLSFENSQNTGYVTEKVLHAKMAGCVPLYWGSLQTDDFVPHSFINLSAISSVETVVDVIKKLESRPDLCAKMASTPILDEMRKQKAMDAMQKMCQKMLALIVKPISEPLTKISKTFIVNLDSRPDRWNSLIEAEPHLEKMATRISAVHGKTLKLTRTIYNRYKNNPFQWKKAIIGCYLSHINIWKQICKESGDMFLVLEDDVRFESGWMTQWNRAASCIPADAELLYWGGVLPPNKSGLSHVLEPINDYWARIRPNTMCSKTPLPVFHFCTYSYVITKAGARKLLEFIETLDGMPYSGCDHLLGRAGLQTYVATPLLTKCAQEEDPAYIYSQFNDLHREDKFDSDIWNNNDCFTIDDLAPFFDESVMNLYYLSIDNKDYELYERTWLEDMFQCAITCCPFTSLDELESGAWILLQRPYSTVWCDMLEKVTTPFRILHLSDEIGEDDLSLYQHPMCKGIVRNYIRENVPSKCVTIPLGYHHRDTSDPVPMDSRKYRWSFHGTGWYNRPEQLASFDTYQPYHCRLLNKWNHPNGSKEQEYLDVLRNSQFCPILMGNNMETYRLYEALESNVLPLFGPSISADYIKWVKQHIDLTDIYDWTSLESMNLPMEIKIKACQEMKKKWELWKSEIRNNCSDIMKL